MCLINRNCKKHKFSVCENQVSQQFLVEIRLYSQLNFLCQWLKWVRHFSVNINLKLIYLNWKLWQQLFFRCPLCGHVGLDKKVAARVWFNYMWTSPLHGGFSSNSHFLLLKIERWQFPIQNGVLLCVNADWDSCIHDSLVHE